MLSNSKSAGESSRAFETDQITPTTPIPVKFPMSPILGACLNFHVVESGGSCSYACTICGKIFPTTQALGGHQNAHRKERNDQRLSEIIREEKEQKERATAAAAAKENDKDKTPVLSPDPMRWALPARVDDDKDDDDDVIIINNKTNNNIINKSNNNNNNDNNNYSGNGKSPVLAYEFFHFMPMPGDLINRNLARVGFGNIGSSSGNGCGGFGIGYSGGNGGGSGDAGVQIKKRSNEDVDGGDYHKKKKVKFFDADDDLKAVMPSVKLSLATYGGRGMEGSASGLDWEDGEYMHVGAGGELDLALKL